MAESCSANRRGSDRCHRQSFPRALKNNYLNIYMSREWRTGGGKGDPFASLLFKGSSGGYLAWSHCLVGSRGKLFLYSLAQKPACC